MPLSRRDFVETALTLAAASLAGMPPATAAGEEADPAASAGSGRPVANLAKLRVAVIGVNGQ